MVLDHIVTRGGRGLTVQSSGDPAGRPVFLLHGTPGSRVGPKPRDSVLYRLGVRLLCYDRPGYGDSHRQPGRSVAHAADDVKAIADHLRIGTFALIGRSGGGPHALAAAALLPERVSRAVILVGLAPADAQELDWFHGMTDMNVRAYTAVDVDRSKLVERLRLQADRARRDPDSLVEVLRAQMTDPDLRVVDNIVMRRLLAQAFAEALRRGPYGWIDDVLALRSDWGFEPHAIRPPVLLWHGADDNFSPASHTRWLASRIPGARARVQARTAHFGAVRVLPEMLAWLVGSERMGIEQAVGNLR
jgi:pimeloyl-ACP methyl ester carboxylesterase